MSTPSTTLRLEKSGMPYSQIMKNTSRSTNCGLDLCYSGIVQYVNIMVYVSGGQMVDNKSPWRLSIIPDFFWGIVNFIVLFFQTLVNPAANSKGNSYSSDYRASGRGPDPYGGGGGGPRRRMGGFRGGAGGPSAPPMAGGG